MHKNFKYRIYPTRSQETTLNKWLEECRLLYNNFLEQRKTSWESEKKGVNFHAQVVSIPPMKKKRPQLTTVHSQVLQNVAMRVDLAYKAFFRRCKAGEEPGYPRFKGYGRYDSITFPQVPSGCSIKDDRLFVSKIGLISTEFHRPIEGVPKTATIQHTSTGKWFVIFSCEIPENTMPAIAAQVGIDVGLKSFATMSNGESIEAPKFFRSEEKELAKAQRKLDKETKGTKERAKKRKVVSRIHERIRNRRSNFTHQLSRNIVNSFGVICVEDLQVNRMLHNHCLAKSISDAAWSEFFSRLSSKAAEAGRTMVKVNPAYTSQTCSQCGHRQKLKLSDRVFDCPCCGLHIDRDLNAAVNILTLGLQSQGLSREAHAFQAWK